MTGGTEGSGGMSGAGLLQNRMASVAGQTMNRLFSFGRAQLFEGRKPEEAEEGTPRPAVPSALLTPTDSERCAPQTDSLAPLTSYFRGWTHSSV